MEPLTGNRELLSSETVFDGRIFKAFLDRVRLPNGNEVTRERVTHPGAVGIVPLFPDGTILMVRQYRHPTRQELLEIPAGKLEPGESPEACARRELIEEVGHAAGEMVKLAEFYNSPGYSDEYFHLYLGKELVPEEGEPEPDEFIELVRTSLGEAPGLVTTGIIRDAKSIIGIALTILFLEERITSFLGEDIDR